TLPFKYLHNSSIAVFIDGSAPLAFAIDQSFDTKIHPIVHIPQFNGKDYQPAITLQSSQSNQTSISNNPENILQQTNTLQSIVRAVTTFKQHIKNHAKDVLPLFLGSDIEAIQKVIQQAKVSDSEGNKDEFDLDANEGKLVFNRGLLHALVMNVPDDKQKERIG